MNAHIRPPENERLAALERYDLLDTPAELSFDRITRIVSTALDVPMASISLIDAHRQWLKSRQGPLGQQGCKGQSFCNVAIQMPEPLIVTDAASDARFKDNAFVVGPPFIRSYAGATLRTPDGHSIGALCAIDTKPRQFNPGQIALLKDLADMVVDAFEARRVARTDSLTGTLTRRGFRDEAERAVALSARHSHPVSCLALDLDHFKTINDKHGHAIGDRVLMEAANVCLGRLRSSDILGRIGGEEFAIILPHTDLAAAFKIAEEIRAALEQRAIMLPAETINVTASFGVVSRNNKDTGLDELLERADAALYAAKAAGRNTCRTWTPPPGASVIDVRRVLKAGRIVFNAGRSIIDCTVRGLGERAARVQVVSTAGIPDRFKLTIPDDGFSRACNITGRQNLTLDLAFV